MYSPIAQLSGAIDWVGVPATYPGGKVTSQPATGVAVWFHTCSGINPSGVENALSALR